MKQFFKLFIAWLFILTGSCPSYAQTSPGRRVDGTVFPGLLNNNVNFVRAPQPYNDADVNSTNIATSSATLTRDAGNSFNGNASWSCDTSANAGYCEWKLNPILAPANGGNCMAIAYVKGDGSLYSLQITDGTTARVSAGLSNATSASFGVPFIVNYPCQATPTVRITQTTAGTSSAVSAVIGYGSATNIGQGIPNNTFSAKVSVTGVVSDENQDFINGNCSIASTSNYTCTFNSNFFTQTPSCTATPFTGSGAISVLINAQSSSAVTAVTFTTNTTTNTAAAFNLICTRASNDFIQPTITPNNWNYSPRAYTPTFTGFGTVTNVDCTEARQGVYNIIDCRFTAGTSTATEARVSLPTGNTSVTFSPTGTKVAGWSGNNRSSTVLFNWAPLIESGVTYLTFGQQDSTNSILTKRNGSDIVSSGVVVHFKAYVQIAGWTENQNAPQLLGSVTSNASSALRLESATITGGSLGTVCSAGTCTTTNPSTPGVFTATFNSTGAYTLAITAGAFSAVPQCFFKGSNNSGVIYCTNTSTPTATSTSVVCSTASGGGTLVNTYFDVMCFGPR